jgi:hypothetical protein
MNRTARFVAPVLMGMAVAATVPYSVAASDNGPFFSVVPYEFDPAGTRLVASEWKGGIGCPSNGRISPDGATTTPYSDAGCPTGDPSDRTNQGLLLAKTGPTANFAAAGASLKGVKGRHLTELGYDIRKPDAFVDPRGSHCGAGAPRFDVITEDNVDHFVGCASPPPLQTAIGISALGNGWIRLRWTAAQLALALPPISPGDTVKSIDIIFDEGQDTGPDNFGLAVLDNIDVNQMLVGRGPTRPEDHDRDEGQGEDKDHRHYEFHNSQSRPETSSMSYEDRSAGVKVQSVSGARAITYNGACVSFVSDALFNGDPDYIVSFASCDLSALPVLVLGAAPSIGNYTIAVTGPTGVVYQKAGDLVSGGVSIHK